jgi:TPP-dependent pyruvate/acetoin dehydrogenase alpha subunit
MFDAELYREKAEVEEWKKKDPIQKLQQLLLKENIITTNEIEDINRRVETVVQNAADFAESGTWEPVERLTKFVYSEKQDT